MALDEHWLWCKVWATLWTQEARFCGTGAVAEKANLGMLLMKRASLIGSTLRNRTVHFKANLVQNLRRDFADERKRGDIKPIIDKVCWIYQVETSVAQSQSNNCCTP